MEPLWEQTRRLIYKLMGKYFPLCSKKGMEPEDLKQSGYFVLVRAVEAYKPEKGLLFTSYLHYHVQTVVADAFGHRGRHSALPRIVSLDEPVRGMEDSGITLGDSIEDPEAAEALELVQEDVSRQQFRACLEECMADMDPAMVDTIRARYFEGKTLQALADERGVSRERIRQLEANGLRQLRRPHRARQLRTFLSAEDCSGYGWTSFKNRGFVSKVELLAGTF